MKNYTKNYFIASLIIIGLIAFSLVAIVGSYFFLVEAVFLTAFLTAFLIFERSTLSAIFSSFTTGAGITGVATLGSRIFKILSSLALIAPKSGTP